MNYKLEDFAGCAINPLQKNLLENNPRLKNLIPIIQKNEEELNEDGEEESSVVFFEPKEVEEIFRYIIILYDPKSPLFKNERDLNRRKAAAAVIAKLENNTDYLATIYDCTHELIVPLTIGYLQKIAKSMEYAAIMVIENCFWESTQKLMEPISGRNSKDELDAVQKKSAIKDELDKDIIRLDKYVKAFFGEDEQLAAQAKKRISPESMSDL